MIRKRNDQKASKTVRLLTVFTVILALIMLLFLGRMVSELHRVFSRDPYSSMDYDLKEWDYAAMVTEYYRRGFDVDPFSSAHEEEYYIAQYADAAFMHRFYQATDNPEAAEACAELMDKSRQGSGSLSDVTGDIDRLVEGIRLYS